MSKVIIGNARFAYINLQHSGRYSVTVLIPRHDRKTVRRLKASINEAVRVGMRSCWTDQTPQINIPPLAVYEDDEEYYYLNASSITPPGIVDANLQTIRPEELQSGCKGMVSLSLYPYDSNGRRGIGVGLNNLQIIER